MALTSRDVMFVLRAQDFASRRVGAVSGAFNKLGKEMQASRDRVAEFNKQLSEAVHGRTQPLREQNRELQERNQIMRHSIAEIRNENAAIRTGLQETRAGYAQQIEQLRERNENMRSYQNQARDANRVIRDNLRSTLSGHRQEIRAIEERNSAIRQSSTMHRSMIADQEAIRSRMVGNLTQEINQRRTAMALNEAEIGNLQRHAAASDREAQRRIQDLTRQNELHREQSGILRAARTEENDRFERATRMSRQELNHNKRALDMNREVINGHRREMQAAQDSANAKIAENEKYIANRQRLIDRNQQLINQYGRSSSAAARAAQAEIRANDEKITGLNRTIRANERVITSNRQQIRGIEDQAARAVTAYGRHEEAIQRNIVMQQQLAQRMMMGGAAATVMGTIMAGVGGSIVSSFMDATRGAAEFQHGLALARTQADGLGIELSDLTRVALSVGRDVPAAFDEIPQTLFFIFTSLRAEIGQAEDLLEGFAKEAVAGNASMEASARSSIAMINAMGLEIEDLGRIQDFQFQTVRRGVITYEELANNIGKILPALSRMGQEIETGGAMMAFLTRQGLSAEMAATSAARALELFSDPRVVARLEDQGVEIRNTAGEFADMETIINSLAEEFDGLTRPERAEQMRNIFGGAGFRIQARRFLDTVFENLDHFNDQIQWSIDNVGAFERAFEMMSQEPHVRLQELSNQFFALRHEIGVAFLPVLESLIDLVRSGVDWFANMSEASRSNLVQIIALAGAGMVLVGALTALAGIMITVAGMLVMMNVAVPTAITAVGLFIPVVAGLTAAIGLLILNGGDLRETFRTVFGEFEGFEGVLKAATIAVGLLTVAFGVFARAGFAASVAGITRAFTVMPGAIAGAIAKIAGLMAMHPILLILTGATIALYTAWRRAGRESREFKEAVEAHTDSINEDIGAIMGSADAFKDRESTIRSSIEETARASLKEKELEDALRSVSGFTRTQYLRSISDVMGAREENLRAIDAEIEAAEGQVRQVDLLRNVIPGLTSDTYDHVIALKDLRREYQLQNRAAQENRRQLALELIDREGLEEQVGRLMIAEMNLQHLRNLGMDVSDDVLDSYKEEILAILTAAGAIDELDDETLAYLQNHEDLGEELEDGTEIWTRYGEAIGNVFDTILDSGGAITDALNAINEANREAAEGTEEVAESFDTLIEAFGEGEGAARQAASAWLDALNEQHDESVKLFGNMNDVYARHADEIGGDSDRAIVSILELGDAAPQAMEMLAAADPEDFLQILHRIRVEAALTNTEVTSELGNMYSTLQGLQSEFAEVSDEQWTDILMNISVLTSEFTEEMEDHADHLMGAMARIIEDGGELTSAEMLELMTELLDVAEAYGGHIVEYWPTVLDDLAEIIGDHDGSEEELDKVMEALQGIAEAGGEGVVEGLKTKLEEGTATIEQVLRGYNIAMKNGLDPVLTALGQQGVHIAGVTGAGGFTERNAGGIIPGSGPDRDSVLSALTPGEFVLRRKAVENLDLHALHTLNRTGDPYALLPGFNTGGWVTVDDLPKPPAASAYAPPTHPFIDPAMAVAQHIYESAVDWHKEQIPPLGEGIGWEAMWQAVSKVFAGRVNLHSAFRPGAITATGNPSYHGMGRAIDITPSMEIFDWIASNYGNSREIIFSPAGRRQIHNGRNHVYTGVTRAMHWDHIHWAMANGGMGRVNEPTWFLAGENGPEDFAFSPAGVSSKAGDGPGIGNNMDNMLGVLSGFMSSMKFQNATPTNLGAIGTIDSAMNALMRYEDAQDALKDAYNEVDRLGKRSVEIASEIEQKELQLQKLTENRTASAQELLNILQSEQGVRDAAWDLEQAERGVHKLNNELAVLRQEARVEDMRESLEAMREGPGEPEGLQEQIDAVKRARAEFTAAQFEYERMQSILPTMDSEVDRLLAQYKAEKELADARSNLTEEEKALKEMQEESAVSSRELRIAEIDLALAEEELLKLNRDRKYENETLMEAQYRLKIAEEGLTEAKEAAKAPTQEMIDLEQRLEELYQQQIETSESVVEARRGVTTAELQAVQATTGLISAGHELDGLSERQLAFFEDMAKRSGVATQSIRGLISAIGTLSGAGFQDPRNLVEKQIQDIFSQYGVSLTHGTKESASARVRRIGEEVLSGKRDLASVERSVQIMLADITGISRRAIEAGLFDKGGTLKPGLTLAMNKTGQNEFVFTSDQLQGLGGNTTIVTVDEGAVQVTVEGDADVDEVETAIRSALDDFRDELYVTISRYN